MSWISLPVFGEEGGVSTSLVAVEKTHPALPEDGEGEAAR
jgi:hypothetical protein